MADQEHRCRQSLGVEETGPIKNSAMCDDIEEEYQWH